MDKLENSKNIVDDIELAKWVAENLPIKFIGDSALKAICQPFQVGEIRGAETKEIAKALVATLKSFRGKAGTGRGLAANQIGILKRMIVVWPKDEPEVLINPEIIGLTGKGSYWESCISTGSLIIGEVVRPWRGTFKYLNIQGKENILEADEKQTRLLLHKIDHLNGEICTDKYERNTLKLVQGGKEEVLGYQFKQLA